MTYDEIREKIRIEMNINCDVEWVKVLDNATPVPSSVQDIEFEIPKEGIQLEIKQGTFTFEGGTLSFSAHMGSSGEEHGFVEQHKEVVSGHGSFEFVSPTDIKVASLRVNEHIDL